MLAIALGSAAGMTTRLLLAPLLPTIIDELSISPTKAGLVLTVMWGFAAIIQFPAGRIADASSYKTVIATSLCVLAFGASMLTLTSTFVPFLLGGAIIGLGAGIYQPAAMMKISEMYDQRRAFALGINNSMVNLGGVLAAGIVVVTVSTWTWRAAFIPTVVLLAIILVMVHFSIDEPYVVARARLDLYRTGSRVFGSPDLRWALVAYSLFEIGWLAGSNFLPTLLQVEKGFSSAFASSIFAGVFAIGILVTPLAGRVGDWMSRARIAALAAFVATTGVIVLTFTSSVLFVVAGTFVAATGLAGFWPVMHAHTMEFLEETNKAGDFGAIRTIFLGIGGLGPLYVGFIAETTSYTVAFAGLIPCFLLPMVIMMWRGK